MPRGTDRTGNGDPLRLALTIAQSVEHDPELLLTVVRLALQIAELRHGALIENVDYPPDGRYYRPNRLLPEHSELQRHRWPPNGDRDAWVQGAQGAA